MPMRATVRLLLTTSATRVLMTDRYGREVLSAQLPAASQAHHLATRSLLEALSLWRPVRPRCVLRAPCQPFRTQGSGRPAPSSAAQTLTNGG